MQNMSQNSISVSKVGSVGMSGINGNSGNIYVPNNGQTSAIPDNFIFEEVDPSLDDENDDSDSDTSGLHQVNQTLPFQQGVSNNGLKPGKKTKGRVKIKMEFIQNKLRRYTTFSKRKTGIMKKAYELSTLTGTQVMLLVASETGHVYTFATRKLQPMITSDSGKALIQTCLNSPDPPPGSTSSGNALEQRMKPTGFEETELTCVLGEDDPKTENNSFNMKPVFPVPTQVSSSSLLDQQQSAAVPQREINAVAPVTQQTPTFTLQASAPTPTVIKEQPIVSVVTKPATLKTNPASISSVMTSTASNLPAMQIPLIFQQGAISMLQPTSQQPASQTITVAQSSQSQSVLKPAALSQVVSAINSQMVSSTQNNQTGELNTPLPASTPSAINIMQGMTPGIVMYHTPQGVVYATPTQNIQDRTIFNFQQPATAISMTQADQPSGQQQQIITIPVPVSLSGAPLLQLAPPPSVESSAGEATQMQPPPLKKPKK